MSGGIYEGPDGEKLYGDGREVSPVSGKPIGAEAAMTREKLSQAARPIAVEAHCRYCPGENNDERLKCRKDIEFSAQDIAKFALAQLREQLSDLERRGLLRHTRSCEEAAEAMYGGTEELPCSCGLDEIRKGLEP